MMLLRSGVIDLECCQLFWESGLGLFPILTRLAQVITLLELIFEIVFDPGKGALINLLK